MNEKSLVSTKGSVWSLRGITLCAAAAVVFALPSSSHAAVITLNATGVDVQVDGQGMRIFDTAQPLFTAAGPGNPAIADNVTTATLSVDNIDITEWMTGDGAQVDWLVEGSNVTVPPAGVFTDVIPPSGTTTALHFFVGGTSLRVDIDELQIFRSPTPQGIPAVMFITGTGNVTSQTLPNGVTYDGPVSIAYTSTDAMFGTNSAFGETGVLTISGEGVIPEPASLALAGMGLIGLAVARRRKAG